MILSTDSSTRCSYLGHFSAQARKNEKKSSPKKTYISGNGTFLPQKKLNKTFQKFFTVVKLAVKFFFISALTLSQLVLYFSNKSLSSIKKYIHLVCPS